MWGTLIQRIGGAPTAIDSDAFIDEFFEKTREEETWQLPRVQQEMDAFVAKHMEPGACRGIALVTSGATIVPLDNTNECFVDQAQQLQEYQGPACAEYLLRVGYAVVYVHREDSLEPFSRHFATYIKNGAFMDALRVQDNELVLESKDERTRDNIASIVKLYHDAKSRLLNLKFTSVQQYLRLLRLTSQAMNVAKTKAIVILAATVMDFYVPADVKKPASQKTRGEFSVNFCQVPNLIRKIRKEWCPRAFLVTFKHHLKDDEMIEQAHLDLEKWGVDVIAGTNRQEHPHSILLVSEQDENILSCPPDEDVNDAFATSIAEMHRNFRRTREILEKGKQLLLLSAKFSMLKERDLLNYDADGNKNVKFGVGVKICADRRKVNNGNPPVYELKHIFQNKSRCARVHVWESKIVHDSGQEGMDVVVAFSPAGTAETIKDVWGDFWSGWAEQELIEVRDQLVNVPLTSALDVVASSISGNYTPASNFIRYVWGKIGAAWTDGEQTRFRQSMTNLLAIVLNRRLVEAADVAPLDEILSRPRLMRFNSLMLDQTMSPVHVHPQSRRRRFGSDDEVLSPKNDGDATKVRVHQTIKEYVDDMLQQGFLDVVMEYVQRGAAVHVTGYSMGGMLGELMMLYIGDRARMNQIDASKVSFVGFGTPRVGDAGFAARLRTLFEPEQILIVMHPSDTVHAFPPTGEGYVDSAMKIFLRQQGVGVGRRQPSPFSLLPVSRSIDRVLERGYRAHATETGSKCGFCDNISHSTDQHRCRYCTERGSHRGADCPNRDKPCALCGRSSHCTGEHRCKVCQQYGHRGRECHAQRDVGLAELLTFFRYHHFLYYSSNLKNSVEFADA